MIRGMVSRLADRLKKDGSDFDGWMRLVRSYVVLGERDKAISAITDARNAIGADADKRRRFDEFIKSLGIDGCLLLDRLFFYRAGHGRNIVFDEKGVEHHQGQ